MQFSRSSPQIDPRSVAALQAEGSSVTLALERLESDLTNGSDGQLLATSIRLKFQNLTSKWAFLAQMKGKEIRKSQHSKGKKLKNRVDLLEKQQEIKEKAWQVSLARMLYRCSQDFDRKEVYVTSALKRCAQAKEALAKQLSGAAQELTNTTDYPSSQTPIPQHTNPAFEQSQGFTPSATALTAAFACLQRQQLLGSVNFI